MPSFQSLLQTTAFLTLHGQVSAQIVIGGTTITDHGGGISGHFVGTKCPGILSMNGGKDKAFCCVGGNLSTCEGWPLCEGSATTTVSCATEIPVTATDYTALIESASSKYLGSGSDQDAEPSATVDSAMATATSETTSEEKGTDATSVSAGQATATEDNDNGAMGLKARLVVGIAGGAIWLCFAF
ncbi:hypothetical protein NW752_006999 [Fusarium irregulare]|uniref:Uncharacterized protein n=1 Tax=Fusarium irregulare TaxID=2494466 RepID=A0A9W8U9S8_9HYPO|nr:hypothetical protein NW766_005884 [Fusarium irregulare]KAJ4016063.1 hypothetical protein NW752_006999 [Fusarium irregulare]